MALQSIVSRLAVVVFVLLSLIFLVQASPMAASAPAPGNEVATIEARGKFCHDDVCFGGLDLVPLLLRLYLTINIKLQLLNQYLNGGNYVPIIEDIEQTIRVAIKAIKAYDLSFIDHITGKIWIVAWIWHSMVISVATYFSKWVDRDDSKEVIIQISKIDLALSDCLEAIVDLGGIFGGFVAGCTKLFAKSNLALLRKVKFGSILNILKPSDT